MYQPVYRLDESVVSEASVALRCPGPATSIDNKLAVIQVGLQLLPGPVSLGHYLLIVNRGLIFWSEIIFIPSPLFPKICFSFSRDSPFFTCIVPFLP
jgi:hypothetical protein